MYSVYFKHKNSNYWHLEKTTISLEACIAAFRELLGSFNVIDEMIVRAKHLLVRDSIQYRIVESDAQILTVEQCDKLFRNDEELDKIKAELNKITDAKILKNALLYAKNQVEDTENLILKKYEQEKIMDQHAASGKFGVGGNFEPSLKVKDFLEKEELLFNAEKWLDEKNFFRDDLKDAEKMMFAIAERDFATIKQILDNEKNK